MKKVSNYSIRTAIGLVVTVVLILNLGQGITKGIQIVEKNERNLSLSSLIPHDPISIISDSGFAVFPGSGTEEDPYVIEGYNITTTDDNGIFILGTTKYFTVRNCYVDAEKYGIYIYDIADGTATVINNTCNNNDYDGISLSYSDSSTVANNECINNTYGIWLSYSNSSTVTNNTCINNNDGIYLWFSDNSTVANNTCSSNNSRGIYLRYSGSSTVANNTCSNNDIGILLSDSGSSTVANNTCSYNNWAISFSGSGSSTVVNNTCSSNNTYGIHLYSSGNSTVANNTCNNNTYGIWLSYSNSSTVTNNECSNNTYGIWLSYSNSSTVANNTCSSNNIRGIYLSSSDCVVTYNLLQENEDYGIYLHRSKYYVSSDNIIYHNIFVDNNLGGSSQAYDDGKSNTWYDPETKEGNYWSDLETRCTHKIDGKAHSKDIYPSNRAQSCPNPITVTVLSIVLPLLLCTAILVFVIPKYISPYTRKTIIPYYHQIRAKMKKNPFYNLLKAISVFLVLTIVSGIMLYLAFEEVICSGWDCLLYYYLFRVLTILLASVSLILLFVLIYRFRQFRSSQKKVS